MTALLQNKLLTFLLAVALVVGIIAEGITVYNGWLQTQINQPKVSQSKAEAFKAQMEVLNQSVDPADTKKYYEELEKIRSQYYGEPAPPPPSHAAVDPQNPTLTIQGCPLGQRRIANVCTTTSAAP